MTDRLTKFMTKAGRVSFYLGLAIELIMVIIDKSVITNPYTGLLFRVTFLLFLVSVVSKITTYTRKELVFFALAFLVGGISYKVTGRNEILRFTMFFMACVRGIRRRHAMFFTFYLTVIGMLAIIELSLFGIGGVVSVTEDYGHGVETRWCLGMGHPNSLHCMVAMLIIFGLYLFEKHLRIYSYVLIFVGNLCLYELTKSNTAFLTATFAIVLSAIMKNHRIGRSNVIYLAGEVLFTLGLVYVCVGAIVNPAVHPLFHKIDMAMTGRVSGLWDSTFHDGTLSTWKWFSEPGNDLFFDMGWNRLVYWYGVIPSLFIVAGIILTFRKMRQRKDMDGFVMLLSLCLYTVLEAHLVSQYIGRNYMLLALAGYLPLILKEEECEAGDHVLQAAGRQTDHHTA